MHAKKKKPKRSRRRDKPPEGERAPEARPSARSGKKRSAFLAGGPAVPLAAPGPKKATPATAPGGVQRKATVSEKRVAVGRRGDAFEREADAVAERAVAGKPAGAVSRIAPGGLAGGGAQRKEKEKPEAGAQKKEEEKAQSREEGEAQSETGGEEEAQQQEEEESAQQQDEETQQKETEEAQGKEEGEAQQQEEEEEAAQPQEEEEEAAQSQEEETQQKEDEAAQSQEEEGEAQKQEEEEEAAQSQEEETQQKEDEAAQSQEDEGDAQKKDEEAQEQAASPSRRDKGAVAARAIRERGAGDPLSPTTRRPLEASLGRDLSGVRVHTGSRDRQAAREMGARAFTHQNHIWLGPGESPSNLKLMAHEATHTVQQGAAPKRRGAAAPRPASAPAATGPAPGAVPGARAAIAPSVQRKKAAAGAGTPGKGAAAKATAVPAGEVAPEEVDLKGQTQLEVPEPVTRWLAERKGKRGPVNVRFGSLARGPVEMQMSGKRAKIRKKQAVPLKHELFAPLAEVAPDLAPSLVLAEGRKVRGWVGLAAGAKLPSAGDLTKKLKAMPGLAGLPGFDLSKLPKITNKLEGGVLEVGVTDAKISFGALFAGTLSFSADDERVTSFSGHVQVEAQGLATGALDLARDAKGTVTGKAAVGLNLPKNFSGDFEVAWDGKAASGEGKVGYQGEKLSGSVTLKLMEKQAAAALEAEKKPPPEGEAAAPKKAPKKGKKPKQEEYVVFGEGDLTFTFTDWLNGTAHVIVDPKGFVTIIGKITPQKEYELFPQKDYNKDLFKVEARAAYGIPVVGNIFIFANVGMGAFAKVGPAKLYKIEVDGTYSTDPEKAQSFTIRGSLNLSAAAGLKLRGEAGAGLTIASHDIKAGAGVNALAGIRGYAEATPVIGYREQPAEEGQDKKGEFFIKGDVEIAAQPFLGLSGDLFVELDSPWWSPAPDKKWTWPLGGKEWPLGGSFGIGASVDYVFGSGKIPEVKFQEVDFSADKFLTDLYEDKSQPKSKQPEKPGAWKEKNAAAAQPPPKETTVGDAQPGKAPPMPKAKPKVKPGGPKKADRPADPNACLPSGKTVKQLQKEAAKKGEGAKPSARGGKAVEQEREMRKRKAANTVSQAMAGGIRRSRLLALLAELKGTYGLEQATLDQKDDVTLRNSPPVTMKGRRALAVESSSLKTVKEKGKEKQKFTEKSPKGDKQVGQFASSAPRSRTIFGVIEPHLGSLGFEGKSFPIDLPPKAPKPDKVLAELYYKVPIAETARDSSHTRAVGDLGNLEAGIFGKGAQDYEGGHLIGHQFGGPEIYQNLVPQRGNSVNRGLYAKIENYVDANLPQTESRDTHVKMTVWPRYSGGRKVAMPALADALVRLTGKQVVQKEALAGASFDLDRSLEGHLTAGDVPEPVRTAFAQEGAQLLASARLRVVKTGKSWSITEEDPGDKTSRRIHVIRREDDKLKVRRSKAEGYFLSKDIREAAGKAGGAANLELPSRIPKKIEAEVEVTGVKEVKLPKVAAAGETKDGSKLTRGDYVIVPETGAKQTAKSDKALEEATKDLPEPEKVKVRTRFTLEGN